MVTDPKTERTQTSHRRVLGKVARACTIQHSFFMVTGTLWQGGSLCASDRWMLIWEFLHKHSPYPVNTWGRSQLIPLFTEILYNEKGRILLQKNAVTKEVFQGKCNVTALEITVSKPKVRDCSEVCLCALYLLGRHLLKTGCSSPFPATEWRRTTTEWPSLLVYRLLNRKWKVIRNHVIKLRGHELNVD